MVSTLRNEFKDEKSLLSFCFARIRKTEGKRYNLTASEMRAFARVVFRGKESVVTMDYYKIVEESLVLICKFIDYRLEEPSAYDVLSKEDFISIARKIANSCKVFIDFMTSLHEIEEVDSNKVKEMLVTSRNNVIASANRRWIHFDREDIKTICDIFSNPV
ncbi:hypothetical protein A3J90_05345 [candidate division WOR-1 bacterium RIFOXYC2_FULL_37_10]|nr:MAG: hypothetical protein A3J90_05345 [candidate division WOR-1 bacterium RIFOXYC2_FULL_37_10]